jgi:hypothetical protein
MEELHLHLMRVSSHRNSKRPGESKIGKFQIVAFINKEILRLKIAVKDTVGVAIEKSRRQLMGKFLRGKQR